LLRVCFASGGAELDRLVKEAAGMCAYSWRRLICSGAIAGGAARRV